jgi:hypothetical protein
MCFFTSHSTCWRRRSRWLDRIEKSGQLSWPNLVATAYERAAGIGVTKAICADA